MKKIFTIYTSTALIEPVNSNVSTYLKDVEIINFLDDSIIKEVIANNRATDGVLSRMERYYKIAEEIGSDIIWQTCSSMGDTVDMFQPSISIPIIRIDEQMARNAVEQLDRIAVLATLPTTLGPTITLVKKIAKEMNKDITIIDGLAEGAFDALQAGNPDKHDEMIVAKAVALKDECDGYVLAQGSMARVSQQIIDKSQKPVFTSLESGFKALAEFIENMEN
ncbi:MAG: aspartate/glutamate racemase family protein [Sphaerochaetaceae bacterium]|nr:aspartate/glutamate racemase family protein [Sphaerochaetaceae bacterium]